MSRPLRLTVDPIRCDAYGQCVELLPELIEFDQWGYPIITEELVPEDLQAAAREAVTACPRLALRLRREKATRAQPSARG